MSERKYEFFSLSEFDSPDVKGSGVNMQHSTMEMLDKARALAGIPFVINSGFRTEAFNKVIGGVANSAHLRGYAADIRCYSWSNFEQIVMALILVGFRRIGTHHAYVHADNDPNLEPATWLYDRSNLEQNSRLQFVNAALKMFNFIKLTQ
ncbi:MAG: D-Ala-D-Ala carboxypeptidase family metallohydrolase [Bacteroidia bacterium]|nr:D-Ala-D-Ala carboxypeptidase family metallohydrolase [Bacteroidia bacterium]